MGQRLEGLSDSIVRQGVWHAYQLLGWVPAADVQHNPFTCYPGYESLPLAELDHDLAAARESLFFYFSERRAD